MGEEDNRSSVEDMEEGTSKPPDKEEAEDDLVAAEVEENDRRRRESENNSSDCTAEKSSAGGRGESRGSQSETLTSVQISRSDSQFDVRKSAEVLSEVPVEYSLQPLQATEELKGQVSTVHEDPLKGKSAESSEVQMTIPDGPSKLEPSSSVTESSSSILHPTLTGKEIQLVKNGCSPCLGDQDKQSSASPKPLSSVPMLKTPDGYNWRKYGQKQVKNLDGFRSYYRCTFSDCYAKKIECCDRSNRVIETVYRSNHNHDPPQKVNGAKEDRSALPLIPVNGRDVSTHTMSKINDPVPSISSKEPLPAIDQIPESKQQDSCGSDETTEINVKEDHVDGPEFKKRQKRSSIDELGSLPKAGKKPKYVVHAAGDVGISGDGYRWRKYGQKMVKGNSHPRNYYRCTSAGCPVRKHIEKAVDNTSGLVITYKGVHDHDIPVPRKRHSTKSTLLATAAANPVSVENSQTDRTKPCPNQTQWSVDKEGELKSEALKPGKGKTSESAKTLLSIGFEIKPC